MGANSMAQDPVSVVASWIAPARAGDADELSTTAAPMDDPVIALIAEERRLQALATAASTRCDEILATLPENVQKRRARVSFGGKLSGLLGDSFSSEAHLQSHVAPLRRLATVREKVLGGDLEAAYADFDREIGLDQALDELRAGLEEIKAIREASGCETHYREAEALWDQAVEIGDRIFETKPLTLAGAIAMLEWNRDEEYEPLTTHWQTIDTVTAGLRDLQAKGLAASPASESPADSQILGLFREWMAAHRGAQALSDDPKYHDDSDEAKAADNRIIALTRAITDTPAQGAKGLAIKNYLATHMNGLTRCIDAAALSADVWEDTDFERHEDARLERAILEDAIRFWSLPRRGPRARMRLGFGEARMGKRVATLRLGIPRGYLDRVRLPSPIS
jgi:hypothetical protein